MTDMTPATTLNFDRITDRQSVISQSSPVRHNVSNSLDLQDEALCGQIQTLLSQTMP